MAIFSVILLYNEKKPSSDSYTPKIYYESKGPPLIVRSSRRTIKDDSLYSHRTHSHVQNIEASPMNPESP